MMDDKPETDNYDVTQQIGHLLRRVYQRHLSIFQENASDPNLTSVQFVTLCALRDQGPSSQAELVKATGVDQGTIRGVIDRLAARGLITITKDKHDQRKIIMALTAAAEQLLQEMIPTARLISELTMADLNAAERVALLYLLRRILDFYDDKPMSGSPVPRT